MLGRIAVVTLAFCWVGCSKPGERDARAHEAYQYCSACHGEDGSGNPEVGAPAIAGLEAWYVEAQLDKFQKGIRGIHPRDTYGMKMKPMAMALRRDGDFAKVAKYVSRMPAKATAATLTGGDPAKGKIAFATCTACHQADASGNEALKAPNLRHVNDWYLLRQLKNFHSGVRGADPRDVTGAQMAPMAKTLADEQAMKDVVAYIGTLKTGGK